MEELSIINFLYKRIEEQLGKIVVNKEPEPSDDYSISNENGELFIKSLGLAPIGPVIETLSGSGFDNYNYRFQFILTLPQEEHEDEMLEFTAEVHNIIIGSSYKFKAFKLSSIEPIIHEEEYLARVITYSITLEEKA